MRLTPLFILISCAIHLAGAVAGQKANSGSSQSRAAEDVDDDDLEDESDVPNAGSKSKTGEGAAVQSGPLPPDFQTADWYNSLTSNDRGLLHLVLNSNPVQDPFYMTPAPARRHMGKEGPSSVPDHAIHPWFEFDSGVRRNAIWRSVKTILEQLRDVSFVYGGTYIFYYGRPEENPAASGSSSDKKHAVKYMSRNIAIDDKLKATANDLFKTFVEHLAKPTRAKHNENIKHGNTILKRAQQQAKETRVQQINRSFEQMAEQFQRKRAASNSEPESAAARKKSKASDGRHVSRTTNDPDAASDSDSDATPKKRAVNKGKGKAKSAPKKTTGDDEDDEDEDEDDDEEYPGMHKAMKASVKEHRTRAPGTAGSSSRQRAELQAAAELSWSIANIPHAHGPAARSRSPSALREPDVRGHSEAASRNGDERAKSKSMNKPGAGHQTVGAVFDAELRLQREANRDDTTVPDSQRATPAVSVAESEVVIISSGSEDEAIADELPPAVRKYLRSKPGDNAVNRNAWGRIESIWRSGMTAPDRMGYYETQLVALLKLDPNHQVIRNLVLLLLRHNP